MQRFKKAVAVLLLALFMLYSATSTFIKKEGGIDLSREKTFNSYKVSFITNKAPIVGQQILLGYYFEDANKSEISGVYYLPGKEILIKKDNILINDSNDFAGYFSAHKKNKPSRGIGYIFNESGIYTITSEFEYKNKTLITDFSVDVKTKEKYYEQQIKGEGIAVVTFILIVLIAIYLYEKLEKPEPKGKEQTATSANNRWQVAEKPKNKQKKG